MEPEIIVVEKTIQLLDHGYVKLIPRGCWGDDEIIIESARMSTNKGFQGWGPKKHHEHCHANGFGVECSCPEWVGDEKLLRYLWTHKHFSPFEMAGLTFEIQAPLFVFREWHRHRTQSYNELSGRYSKLPDLYYVPSIERLMNGRQGTKNKQGSEEGFSEAKAQYLQGQLRKQYECARGDYEDMIKMGLSRELARLVVPVAQYSRMRASANLRNWLAFLTLRLAEGAQWEIRQYANAVAVFVKDLFPRTYSLFEESVNV